MPKIKIMALATSGIVFINSDSGNAQNSLDNPQRPPSVLPPSSMMSTRGCCRVYRYYLHPQNKLQVVLVFLLHGWLIHRLNLLKKLLF